MGGTCSALGCSHGLLLFLSLTQDPAIKTKLFLGICENSFKLAKRTEKSRNRDVFQYSRIPVVTGRATRGAACRGLEGAAPSLQGNSVNIPAPTLQMLQIRDSSNGSWKTGECESPMRALEVT